MSDLRFREKLREIEKAAATEDHVPEKAKQLGLLFTALFVCLLIIGIFVLAILSAFGRSFVTSGVLFALGISIASVAWNVYRAPKLP
ncbi:hypothetical protein MKY84_04235 [Chryseomicrobium sp. FSL W7-1435]|uniref:hypothetical protein n=1 Tax=Chryseomicrobium sp. FSL W7-1435 TaxID=2921704 RepID=UPI00315B1C0D